MKMKQYYSEDVTVPVDMVPNHIMECQTALRLHNSRKDRPLDLKYMCDICQNYTAHSKWFMMTHKSTKHGIKIPHDYRG